MIFCHSGQLDIIDCGSPSETNCPVLTMGDAGDRFAAIGEPRSKHYVYDADLYEKPKEIYNDVYRFLQRWLTNSRP